MTGLRESDISYICKILAQFSDIEQALIFGSRAKGTNQKGSDVDIALKGADLGAIVTQIGGILNDDSPLPYYFDVLDYQAITSEKLKDHIDRVGQIIYEKSHDPEK